MSDDDEDNLFADSDADSDDTNELIQSSKAKSAASKPAAANKKPAAAAAKKANSKKPAADSDDDGGLFDSDSDEDSDDSDDNDSPASKKKKTLQKKPAAATKGLSKRERLEALAKRKQQKEAPSSAKAAAASKKDDGDISKKKDAAKKNKEEGDGYQSGDSYDSADFARTKEDDDFLDTTGEDAQAVQELYAEQHFDDERPDREMKKKKKRRQRDADDDDDAQDAEPDNPIMAAVHRMKKKRRQKKSTEEIEDECRAFLGRMEIAAEQDETAVAERRPALQKLALLNEVVDMLTRLDMQEKLLDLGLLVVCRRWIQPLPNGTLGNVTVRQKLLQAIANMGNIHPTHLKQSELGKTVMVLFKHRSETPAMKRQLKALIEQWSRPIFKKSGDMRDLVLVHASRGEGGLAGLSTQRQQMQQMSQKAGGGGAKKEKQDLDSLITSGKKAGGESGINRVRVPFSKGFNYSVRPAARADAAGPSPDRRGKGGGGAAAAKDNRGKLSKRMIEKGRTVGKNQRSANVSIEGRPTK